MTKHIAFLLAFFFTSLSFAGIIINPGSTGLNSTASGLIEEFTGHVQTAGNSTYWIDPYPAYAYTINSVALYTSSGTITCGVKINGTNVTSISAISVTSTPGNTNATGANSVSVGANNAVTLVCSSNSSALDLVYTLKVTRQ